MELSKLVFRYDNVKMKVPVSEADLHDGNPEKSCPVFVVATES